MQKVVSALKNWFRPANSVRSTCLLIKIHNGGVWGEISEYWKIYRLAILKSLKSLSLKEIWSFSFEVLQCWIVKRKFLLIIFEVQAGPTTNQELKAFFSVLGTNKDKTKLFLKIYKINFTLYRQTSEKDSYNMT